MLHMAQHQRQHMVHSGQEAAANNPAKAVQYVCRLLRSFGLGDQLTPELLRKAKFDVHASCQPLLLALHDLALLVLAGFPPKCAEALTRLKQQLQQEALQEAHSGLSQPGRLLLLHCLSEWGCPAGLVAQLTLPQPSSRTVLLALCWLIAHAQLFDRTLEQLQVPQHLLPLLQPYPQDTSHTAEAQSHYQDAARAAQQHHQHIHQLLQAQASTGACQSTASSGRILSSNSNNHSSSWLAVQTAAHHVLATYRAATLRLQQVTCLAEAREKMLHEIQQLQLQQDGSRLEGKQGSGASAARGTRPGCKPAQVLTAFELHLLRDTALLQQHQDALQQAVSLLQQQQECQQHAAVFFAWATSAVAEAAQQQQAGSLGRETSASAIQKQGRSTPAASAGNQQLGQTGLAAVQLPLPAPSLQEMLLLVQQLPPADTQIAAGVLSRVHKQLQQAAAAAGLLQDSPADTPSTAFGSDHSMGASMQAAIDPLAQQLVECRVDSSNAAPLASPHQHASTFVTAAFTQAAAAALVEAGVLPDACTPALQELPADLQHTAQQLQDCSADQQQRRQQQLAAVQQVLSCSRLQRRYQAPQQHKQQPQPHLGTEQLAGASAEDSANSMLGLGSRLGRQVQQQQQDVRSGRSDAAGSVGTGDVQVTAELQRLNGLALQVAKLLAKARAANKQQLAAAAQLLLEAGDEKGHQQLVLYQA